MTKLSGMFKLPDWVKLPKQTNVVKLPQQNKDQFREPFKIPRCVQDIIPVLRIWQDGIFLTGPNLYSKTVAFSDINYRVASLDDKKSFFHKYEDILNALEVGTMAQITIVKRRLNRAEFEKAILLVHEDDGLDSFRDEVNHMLMEKAAGSSGIIQERYLTVTVPKRNIDDARAYFARVFAGLNAQFKRLDSRCTELDANARLKFLHEVYRPGEAEDYHFDLAGSARKGHSFKDYICPDGASFQKDYFEMGSRFGRVLFLKDYGNYIKDKAVSELCTPGEGTVLSISLIPVAMDEALRLAESRHLAVEKNITDYQRHQNTNNNFSAIIPYDMELQRKKSLDLLNDLTTRDQRMFFGTITLMHTADTKEKLDSDTKSILAVGRQYNCQFAPANYRQAQGLNTVLPYGLDNICSLRTLTTESAAVFMPFLVQEIMDRGGIYVGENAVSRNLLICDKALLQNQNAMLLGVPGSGKSFGAKEWIALLALSTDDDILVCDPEGEYGSLIKALKGAVIHIAAGSEDHINAMDMDKDYGEGSNPIIDKSQFIMSLFEQMENQCVGQHEKSIIDRCTEAVYMEHKNGGPLPTLTVLRDKLLQQPEKEAKELALSLELFTVGSLGAFAHPTNVDVKNRIVDYDIFDLGSQLKTMGLLVITDAMINRVTANWRKGRRTHIFIDEFHVVFENEYSGSFFTSAWRRFRKRNAFPTAITQNVDYILDSAQASTMLSNSEFIVMYNQAAQDRDGLARLLQISKDQMGYITDAESGCGLLRYGSAKVPFVNHFPRDTELYRLMTTKPGEF